MKAYTDVEQSKRLAEILPINTADCCYIEYCTSDNIELRYEGQPPMFLGDIPITEIEVEHIPCWSLAALLDILPPIEGFRPIIDLDINLIRYEGNYRDKLCFNGNNLIDACVEMIIKLNKENLL